jgi:hypothetical protein
MTFADYSNLSINDYRVLVQIDISTTNTQWINCGAGIWYVNFDALYPEVGAPGDDLLSGFTAQAFSDIGSVTVDTINYTSVATLALVTTTDTSYYYDSANKEIFVHFVNNDEPYIHTIYLGVIYGYSYNEFTPIGASLCYEGRLVGDLDIGESRDPLYFGKLTYNIGSISLNNADGYFDTFPIDHDFYGNEIRILVGFAQLDISDYTKVVSGTVEKVSVSEDYMNVNILDKRRTLSKSITYTCTNKNALAAIREILYLHYGASYNSSYYDMTAWAAAEAVVPTISIDIATGHSMEEATVIDIIEMICSSVFGMFIIDTDNKYSFKIVDTSASASTTIYSYDINSRHEINYDPSEVVSSVKIGYGKDWNPTGDDYYKSPYTWYTDTTQEAAVYAKYKIYNQYEFFTVLDTLAQATTFGTTVLDYVKDVHGTGEVATPMKYYSIGVGDIVNIEIKRQVNTMLGTKKCEIISRRRSLQTGFLQLGYRII